MSQEESLLCQAYEKQISDIKAEYKAKQQAFLEWLKNCEPENETGTIWRDEAIKKAKEML